MHCSCQVVKIVFIIILYLLHCFGKLRECNQHTEKIQVFGVSLEY
jgi:hypothetical protein